MSKKLILLFLPFMLCFLQGCGVHYLGDGEFVIGKNGLKHLDRPDEPRVRTY